MAEESGRGGLKRPVSYYAPAAGGWELTKAPPGRLKSIIGRYLLAGNPKITQRAAIQGGELPPVSMGSMP
jgi:hypothetical protein